MTRRCRRWRAAIRRRCCCSTGCWRATPAMRGCGWARRRRWNRRVTGAARGSWRNRFADQAPGFTAAPDLSGGRCLACRRGDFNRPFPTGRCAAPRKTPTFPPRISRRSPPPIFQPVLRRSLPKPARALSRTAFRPARSHPCRAAGEWDRGRGESLQASADDRPQRLLHEARHRLRGTIRWRRTACSRGPVLAGDRQNLAHGHCAASRGAGRGSARRIGLAETGRIGAASSPSMRAPGCGRGRRAAAPPCIRSRQLTRSVKSLRGGTQTRGILFRRKKRTRAGRTPCQRSAHSAGDLPAQLPPARPLCQSAAAPPCAPWRLAGSWSVRPHRGGDHHKAHNHPPGIISSAL